MESRKQTDGDSLTPTYDGLNVADKGFVDDILAGRPQYVSYQDNIYKSKTATPTEPSYNYLCRAASRKVRIGKIRQAISERYAAEAMPDAEAAQRQAAIARSSVEVFQRQHPDGRVEIDLTTPQAQAHLHLLKKIKQKKHVRRLEDGQVRVTLETEIELHGVSENLHRIRQAHGAYGAKGTREDPYFVESAHVDLGDLDEADAKELVRAYRERFHTARNGNTRT